MNYIIRDAETSDCDRIAELLVGILKLHARGREDIFCDCGAKYSADDVAHMLTVPSKRIWVAVGEDGVQGYIICIIKQHGSTVMAKRTCLWIDDLCIAPECRGCGIGGALVDTATEFARRSGFDAVELNVWSFNTNAVNFYEKQGFTPQRTVMEKVLAKSAYFRLRRKT